MPKTDPIPQWDANPPTSRHLAKGAGTALLARAGAMIEVVSQPLYVWLFGLPTYGLYMVLWSAVNLVENIADLGMTSALQRVIPQARSDAARADALRNALLWSLSPCTVIAILVSFFAPYIGQVINVSADDKPGLVTGIAVFAWALPLWAFLEVSTSALRARKAFGPEIRLRILWEQVIRMIIATLLWACGVDTLGLLIAHICSLAITCAFSVRLLSQYYDLRLVFTRPRENGRGPVAVLLAGVSVLPSNIINRLFADAPPLILNVIIPGAAGASASGLFAIARKIASLIQLVRMAFSYVMAPLASETVGHDKRYVVEIYGFATRLSVLVAMPIVCVVIGGGKSILGLFGPGATAALWALVVLALARMIEAIFGQASSIQTVVSRYHHPLVGSLLGLLAATIIGVILLPAAGINGMAIAVATGVSISCIVPMVQLWWTEGIHPFHAPFIRTALVTLSIGAVIVFTMTVSAVMPDPLHIALGIFLCPCGIWLAARTGLSVSDKKALGKTARKLRLA
jgi:O-antigen/teichoic acid export membrane protein